MIWILPMEPFHLEELGDQVPLLKHPRETWNSSFWNRILCRYGSKNGEKECEKNVLHRLNSVSIISDLGRISGRNFRKSSCGKLIFIKKII